jgi:hypothetical protein
MNTVAFLCLGRRRRSMTLSRLVLVVAALSLCACAVQPVAPGTVRPITLDTSYTRYCDNTLGGGGVVFPKGVYQPTFQTEGGVYYEAPTFLVGTGLGGGAMHGGLFIPREPSAKQACWVEYTQGHRFTFREPIPYH